LVWLTIILFDLSIYFFVMFLIFWKWYLVYRNANKAIIRRISLFLVMKISKFICYQYIIKNISLFNWTTINLTLEILEAVESLLVSGSRLCLDENRSDSFKISIVTAVSRFSKVLIAYYRLSKRRHFRWKIRFFHAIFASRLIAALQGQRNVRQVLGQ